MIEENKLASLAYNTLLKYYKCQGSRTWGPIWSRLWEQSISWYPGPVSVNVHGRRVLVNNGHAYPLFSRRFKHWNNPLVELVHESAVQLARPVNIVDVGAGIGDTVLLLESNCSSSVKRFMCIEGDLEFFRYLDENLKQSDRYDLHHVMLSSEKSEIPSLIRTHAGTASAQGKITVHAVPLDEIISSEEPPDVIKIDVDGYDGRVLAGSLGTLRKHKPAIIFEWDPALCEKTGNDWSEHFELLKNAGYTRYIWFTKYGDFSHFMTQMDETAIKQMANICISGQRDYNWHYDIVALHQESPIFDTNLAMLKFSKKRSSWH